LDGDEPTRRTASRRLHRRRTQRARRRNHRESAHRPARSSAFALAQRRGAASPAAAHDGGRPPSV